MRRLSFYILAVLMALLIAVVLFKAYLPVASKSAPSSQQAEAAQAIQRGVSFLKGQYKEPPGLLQEAPNCGDYSYNYYLTNDNALAIYTLKALGVEGDLVARLETSLRQYCYNSNGFIEAAWGVPIHWPPWHHDDITVTVASQVAIVKQETHHEALGYFYDWSAFSNLAFMGALNEYNLGYTQSAIRLYEIEMSTWDGLGFRDQAWSNSQGLYETIGPAWALYVGFKINAPTMKDDAPKLVASLLARQGESGGFNTHYDAANPQARCYNVETTSLALLGLHAYLERSTP